MNLYRTGLALLLVSGLVASSRAATNRFSVTASSFSNFTIDGQPDPALTLVRGFTYTFDLNASGHPFWIKLPPGGIGTGNAYSSGVTNNGTSVGSITFAVPVDAPDLLQYNCQFHAAMTGPIHIEDPPVIQITDLTADTETVIQSTGTDALDLQILVRTDLTNGVWENAVIQLNSYANGTNSTQVAVPAGDSAFFQVRQGFF